MTKHYLGDGAYAEFSDYGVRIFTSNGISESIGTHLGPVELIVLIEFCKKEGLIRDEPRMDPALNGEA